MIIFKKKICASYLKVLLKEIEYFCAIASNKIAVTTGWLMPIDEPRTYW